MSAAGWRSEGSLPRDRPELGYGDARVFGPETLSDPARVRRQRAEGSIGLGVESVGGRTLLRRRAEAGSARVRLPRGPGPGLEAVLINTAGGLAGGDRMAYDIEAGEGADLVVATAAAEKVYKAEREASSVEVTLRLGASSRLAWLPQETILFERARLVRRLDVEMAADARLLLAEATVFGRVAHDEEVTQGLFDDRWRIRRGGRLVYADRFRLSGAVAARLADPAVAAGARAMATLLYIASDTAARVEEARALMQGAACECGAGAWDGCLAVRFLAADVQTLRSDLAGVIAGLGGRPLPRVWHL
jgi:urease accessory protein